jgi:transposase
MRSLTLWARMSCLPRTTIIEDVVFDDEVQAVILHVRPRKKARRRCGVCGRRCPLYDHGDGRRRWRTLDLGCLRCFLEADAPRVSCPRHGVVVAQVPWARHNVGYTYAFEDTVAWLATRLSRSAVEELMRITWRSVGRIITRVVTSQRAASDPYAGVRRIGVDEVSYKRGHRYLTVVVDHDRGRLLWAAAGRDEATLERFFAELGEERSRAITLVTADAADWIRNVVRRRCPNATICLDPFHVVSWAQDALDQVRRAVWNEARKSGQKAQAKAIKDLRFALWKNPEDLTERQRQGLAAIAKTNEPLYRAYLLKEQLRQVFHLPPLAAMRLLRQWLAWASRSQLEPFVELAKTIRAQRSAIAQSLRYRASNALVESVNTKIRLLTRIAFGFRSETALISLALLSLGGYCPSLPGRP